MMPKSISIFCVLLMVTIEFAVCVPVSATSDSIPAKNIIKVSNSTIDIPDTGMNGISPMTQPPCSQGINCSAVKDWTFWWEVDLSTTGDYATTGLHIWDAYYKNKLVIKSAWMHGVRIKYSSSGSEVSQDLTTSATRPVHDWSPNETYGGSPTDWMLIYDTFYWTTDDGGNHYNTMFEYARVEISNTANGPEIMFSLAERWNCNNAQHCGMYYWESSWKIDYSVSPYSSHADDCYANSAQLSQETALDTSTYTDVEWVAHSGGHTVESDYTGISTYGGHDPSKLYNACIRDWTANGEHKLNDNIDGDSVQNADIYGAWDIYNDAWTSTYIYGENNIGYVQGY